MRDDIAEELLKAAHKIVGAIDDVAEKLDHIDNRLMDLHRELEIGPLPGIKDEMEKLNEITESMRRDIDHGLTTLVRGQA